MEVNWESVVHFYEPFVVQILRCMLMLCQEKYLWNVSREELELDEGVESLCFIF